MNFDTEDYNKNCTQIINIKQLRDEESKKIRRLLLGSIVNFSLIELLEVLSRQNILNINTLSIQKSGEQFWCVVDEPTYKYWQEQKLKFNEFSDKREV